MAAKIFMDFPGGVKMPAIGIGTWQCTDESELERALDAALEIGYRHIDTAFVYENEKVVGKVINQWISSGKLKRNDLFVTTKLPPCGGHPDRVELFMKKSLENLQLDYVDLYLIHVPVATRYDEVKIETMEPIETDHIAIWKAMEKQVDAGRTKAIGISNFNVKQIDRILKSKPRIKPSCLQVELHVYMQQRELVNFCHQNGIVVVAYSPLGSPGYNKFLSAFGTERQLPDMLHDPVITRIAKSHKKSNAQVMLRYLLQKNIVAIPKSVTPARIKENIDVFDFELSAKELKELDALEVGEDARIVNFQVFKAFPEHPEFPWPSPKK